LSTDYVFLAIKMNMKVERANLLEVIKIELLSKLLCLENSFFQHKMKKKKKKKISMFDTTSNPAWRTE